MRIVFLGSGDIALPSLQFLADAPDHDVAALVTQPDKPSGRRMECKPSEIKKLAGALGIPVLQPRRIRDDSAVQEVAALAPEAIVVMAYGQILPKSLLHLPRVACLNLHASLLPRHRGASPIQAAILAGEERSGITVMYMAEGLDTGDILLERELAIGAEETGGSLHDRLAQLAPESLREALTLLVEGRAPRTPQIESQATYAPKLAREDGEIAWGISAVEIARRIRAFDPWPTAYAWLPTRGGRIKLKLFPPIQAGCASGSAGEVLLVSGAGLCIAAGTGSISVGEVQLEGKRRMSASAFANGHAIAPGTIFGGR